MIPTSACISLPSCSRRSRAPAMMGQRRTRRRNQHFDCSGGGEGGRQRRRQALRRWVPDLPLECKAICPSLFWGARVVLSWLMADRQGSAAVQSTFLRTESAIWRGFWWIGGRPPDWAYDFNMGCHPFHGPRNDFCMKGQDACNNSPDSAASPIGVVYAEPRKVVCHVRNRETRS